MLLQRLIWLTATPTPEPDKGWFEEFIERGRQSRTDADTKIIDGVFGQWLKGELIELLKDAFNFISPIVDWGCKLIIASCVLIFLITYERKYVATALKWFLIFIIYCFIKGAMK